MFRSLALLLLAVPCVAGNAPAERGFVHKVHKGKDGDAKYVVFVPHDYTPEKEYPVILFLHGSGERGDDGMAPVLQGIGNAIKFKNHEKSFPFLVVFPQARKGGNWKAGEPDARSALAILDEVQRAYRTDPKRVYLTGLSMGGYGTWSLAAAHPGRWAALVPICGGGDPATADQIKHIPVWCFHGADDKGVPAKLSRAMIEALRKAGAEPRYTEYPYVGHNSWDPAYVTPELYPWLLSRKLP